MSGVPQVGLDGRGRLVARNVYQWHEAIGDLPGSRWARSARVWTLPGTPGSCAALLTILSGSGAAVSQRVWDLAQEAAGRERRSAEIADESQPLPKVDWSRVLRTSPWPHQERSVHFLTASSNPLLAVAMGGGKSLPVVAAANVRELSRLLVVAPVSVAGVWPREFRLHSAREWHVDNGVRRTRRGGLKRLSLAEQWRQAEWLLAAGRGGCGCGRPHAVVIGYEAMTRDPVASADLAGLGVQAVVYDEAHRLKGAGSGSSWTAKSWVSQVPWRIALTGTPMPQTPDDAYGLFRALDPAIFGTSKTEFRARFIVMGQTKDGRSIPRDVVKAQRPEFARRFFSVTYLPKVDLALPPVVSVVRTVELEASARRVYDDLRDRGVADIRAAVAEAGGDPGGEDAREVTPANAAVELLRFMQATGGAVNDDEGSPAVISAAKQRGLGEILAEVGCAPGGRDGRSRPEPVVVFCRFRHDLSAIAAAAREAGVVYREVSGARKDGLDEDSRMAPDADVVGVQISAGGVGVDFTRARVGVWYSAGFELWAYQQAWARMHRPGQTRTVTYYYLLAENTVDGAVYAALARKEQVIESVLRAYLRDTAEVGAEGLPAMPTESPRSGSGEPVVLPEWMGAGPGSGGRGRRAVADRERDAEQGVLALGGLEGF